MNISRNMWWMAPLALLISFPLWKAVITNFFAIGTEGDGTTSIVRSSGQAFGMDEISFVRHTEDGEVGLTVRAGKVFTADSNSFIDLEHLEASFAPKTSKIFAIASGEARYDIVQRTLTLMDNVKVTTPEGYTLEGDVLRYLEKYGRIKTGSGIVFHGPGVQISGGGFSYDVSTGDFRIGGLGRVVCDFIPGEKAPDPAPGS